MKTGICVILVCVVCYAIALICIANYADMQRAKLIQQTLETCEVR